MILLLDSRASPLSPLLHLCEILMEKTAAELQLLDWQFTILHYSVSFICYHTWHLVINYSYVTGCMHCMWLLLQGVHVTHVYAMLHIVD